MKAKTKLAVYLEQQYVTWQGREGARRTLREWAEYLGVPYEQLRLWMGGFRAVPRAKLPTLAAKMDDGIYEAARIDPRLQKITDEWFNADDSLRDEMLRLFVKGMRKRGHDIDLTNGTIADEDDNGG